MFHPVYTRGVPTRSPGRSPQPRPPTKTDSEGKVDAVVQQHQALLAMVVMAGAKQIADKKALEQGPPPVEKEQPQQQPPVGSTQPPALVEGTLEIVEMGDAQPPTPQETGEQKIQRLQAEIEQRGTEALAAQKGPQKRRDRNMAIIAGVITLVVLAAIAAGLAQHLVGLDKLGQTPITIAQGLAFIGLPVLGGIILLAVVMRWTPPVVRSIELACLNRKIAKVHKQTKY